MEAIFSEVVKVIIKCRHCDERKARIRVTIERQSSTSAVCRRDLLMRLTNDEDPHFFFSLTISEEDFQSLKVQQELLIEFASFPEMLVQLLRQCQSEQNCSHPRFQLLFSSDSPSLDGPVQLSVMETNSFKHSNQLSLRLTQGSDKHVKDYLAACLASVKAEKEALELKLKKTEDDLTRRLNDTEQTLSEMERMHLEWTLEKNSLCSRHADELRREQEKAADLQERQQQQMQKHCRELESAHQRDRQQMQSRLVQLETSCGELSNRDYQNQATLRDLKAKLAAAEEECQRFQQQVASMRRQRDSAETALHANERLGQQLQTRVGTLEQEAKDREQNASRTQEALKETLEEDARSKEAKLQKLDAQVEILSADVKKANEIIKKFMCELQVLQSKNKDKNVALVEQKKVLRDTSTQLDRAQGQVRDAHQQLQQKDRQVASLREQLESSMKKLAESKELLRSNENGERKSPARGVFTRHLLSVSLSVIGWINKHLNEKRLSEMLAEPPQSTPPTAAITSAAHFYPHVSKSPAMPDVVYKSAASPSSGGLDAKYFKRRDEGGVPVRGSPNALIAREFPCSKTPSAYFPN
ncbi:spindle assembly abnormal protein 6 homolog isoform X2 [Syngnathus scovelli]|uniref:spindle assembly abnormal protein 6 homolog isoform X2 n=1 Tax=Syngnathus scovelli TaxID=161590 RepID=UPI0021100533|nr:spindle assembly abnormal protein 6 homolog isoform X2 [Syngnathus scovelli]